MERGGGGFYWIKSVVQKHLDLSGCYFQSALQNDYPWNFCEVEVKQGKLFSVVVFFCFNKVLGAFISNPTYSDTPESIRLCAVYFQYKYSCSLSPLGFARLKRKNIVMKTKNSSE